MILQEDFILIKEGVIPMKINIREKTSWKLPALRRFAVKKKGAIWRVYFIRDTKFTDVYANVMYSHQSVEVVNEFRTKTFDLAGRK